MSIIAQIPRSTQLSHALGSLAPVPKGCQSAHGAAVFSIIDEPGQIVKHSQPPKSNTTIAIYPGSFDPITNGHLDLIQRGSRLFDRLIVSILRNERKEPLFTVEERAEMLREVVGGYPNVEVDSFDGLLVDYAAARSATVLLRGIRAISDYEYDFKWRS